VTSDFIAREALSPLAPQMLYPGMASEWQSGTLVAGRALGSHRIMAGAPCGPLSRLRAASAHVECDARGQGRRVLWFGLTSQECEAMAAADFRRIHLGDQAILDARQWAAPEALPSSLRAQIRRGSRHPFKTLGLMLAPQEWVETTRLYPWLATALAECRQAWLKSRGPFTLGFMTTSLGPNHEAWHGYPLRYLTVAYRERHPAHACSALGARPFEVVGYAVAAAVPRGKSLLVENCVRLPDAPNGLIELLLHRVARWGLSWGCVDMNMGLAPLWRGRGSREPGERCGHMPFWYGKATSMLLRFGEPLYKFRGLGRFKQRLHPKAWQPLYLVAPRDGFKPRDGWALMRAFLANGG
jgi:phosphatidylglycerol lysyltransferase